MLEEEFCDFELAQLLKANGFEGEANTSYGQNGFKYPTSLLKLANKLNLDTIILCPTLQMARQWIKITKNIDICVTIRNGVYVVELFLDMEFIDASDLYTQHFKTSEDATKYAIRYCIENF